MQPPQYLPPKCGKRLIPQIIDELAGANPRKVFASYPISPNLQDGFRDVNYLQLANAINTCAWWIEGQVGKGHNFETLAYIGPSDLRYAILTIAAIKAGYKVSPATSACMLIMSLLIQGRRLSSHRHGIASRDIWHFSKHLSAITSSSRK